MGAPSAAARSRGAVDDGERGDRSGHFDEPRHGKPATRGHGEGQRAGRDGPGCPFGRGRCCSTEGCRALVLRVDNSA